MRNSGRLGMAAWLQEKLREESFPQQLWWVDKEKEIFALRWMHASCASYDPAIDSVVFHEWAKHTGNARSQSDGAKTWKATFRCALASVKTLKMIHKNPGHRGTTPPTVVYKFVKKVDAKRKRKTQPRCPNSGPTEIPQLDINDQSLAGSSTDFIDRPQWEDMERQISLWLNDSDSFLYNL